MHKHFDKHLNVKELIEEVGPLFVLELGAGSGENTRQLLTKTSVEVISLGECPEDLENRILLRWVNGISYMVMEQRQLYDVQFAIVDTDHNGWTLDKELIELDRICTNDAIICIHDTESFREANGFCNGYNEKAYYPKYDIINGPTYSMALNSFLLSHKWKIYRETKESCGAVALKRYG